MNLLDNQPKPQEQTPSQLEMYLKEIEEVKQENSYLKLRVLKLEEDQRLVLELNELLLEKLTLLTSAGVEVAQSE